MNTTTVQPARSVAAVESILRELSELPPDHYLTLGNDDPFYEEPMPVRVRPATDFSDADEMAAMIGTRKPFNSADIFDLTGRRVPRTERPAEWWEAQRAITPTSGVFYESNAVHRLGHDYLIVGRGMYYVVAETWLDGKRAFETITIEESMRRDMEALEEYMPAVLAAKPGWAEEPTLKSIDDLSEADTIGVSFTRRGFLPNGFAWDAEVSIDQYVTISRQTGAVVRVDTLTPTVYVAEPRRIADAAGMSPEQLRALSSAVRMMADVLEAIQAK
jgi:hypothetical protein